MLACIGVLLKGDQYGGRGSVGHRVVLHKVRDGLNIAIRSVTPPAGSLRRVTKLLPSGAHLVA